MNQSRFGQQVAKSPTELALAEFGSGRYAKVAGERQAGNWAVVLALTNEEPDLYPYEMVFHKDAGGWREVAGSNGPGWRPADGGSGFVTAWGETQAGVSQVRVSYEGAMETVQVVSGYYLAVFWGVPEGDFDPSTLPQVVPS